MRLTLLVLTLLLTVSVKGQVNSDFDKSTDFSKYKTYSFAGWQKDSDKLLNDFDKKRITDALISEFQIRGLNYVESGGDAAITLYLVLKSKTDVTAYTNYNGGMGYSGRWGYSRGYGMNSATTSVDTYDYLEGTLIVDMYDTTDKNLIWQGDITAVVQEKTAKREKTIPKKMKKLMKKFPVKPIKS